MFIMRPLATCYSQEMSVLHEVQPRSEQERRLRASRNIETDSTKDKEYALQELTARVDLTRSGELMKLYQISPG